MKFLSEFQQFEMVERAAHRNPKPYRASQLRWINADSTLYLLWTPQECLLLNAAFSKVEATTKSPARVLIVFSLKTS